MYLEIAEINICPNKPKPKIRQIIWSNIFQLSLYLIDEKFKMSHESLKQGVETQDKGYLVQDKTWMMNQV